MMSTIDGTRQNIATTIEKTIGLREMALDRELLGYAFYYSKKSRAWGSLARGSLVVLLANEHMSMLKNAVGIELIHHASLIVDDLLDRARMRRGEKAFWIRYGPNIAILFAHKMVNKAVHLLNHDEVVRDVIDQMLSSEIYAQKDKVTSIEQYSERVRKKTGALFGLAAHLAATCPCSAILNLKDNRQALEEIGISHQILDDLKDARQTERSPTLFYTKKAQRQNFQHSILSLLQYGYSEAELRAYHHDLAFRSLKRLRNSIHGSLINEIMGLCWTIALGPSHRDLPRGALDCSSPECRLESRTLDH
jgi:hypothetical protein